MSNVTLTVTTNPASATCTLRYNNIDYTTKTLEVKAGSTVTYTVYHSTYGTTTGSILMDSNKTLNCTGTYSTSSSNVSWTRPNLTSNGTMGSSNYAASASVIESGSAYYAFDNKTTDYTNTACQCKIGDINWKFYSKNKIRATSMTFKYASKNTSIITITAYIHGSNNNSSWTQLGTFSWSVRTQWNATQTANVNISNTNYFNYLRLSITTQSHTAYLIDWAMSGYQQQTSYNYYWDKSIS